MIDTNVLLELVKYGDIKSKMHEAILSFVENRFSTLVPAFTTMANDFNSIDEVKLNKARWFFRTLFDKLDHEGIKYMVFVISNLNGRL